MYPGPYAPSAPQHPAAAIGHLVRPAKSWFAVAAVIAVAGIVLAVVVLVTGIMRFADRVDAFDRADVPTTLTVELDTGGYSIYHEYDGADDSGTYYTFQPDPEVSVVDPSGDTVALDRYDGSVTYSASGHEGEGLYTFDADEAGTYTVTASGESGSGIAVGRGIGRGLVASILGSIAIGLLAVVAGSVLAIVVGVKRSSSRRALMPPPVVGGWGPPPPPGWGGPAGYGPPGGYGPGGYGPGGPGGPGGYGPGSGAPVPPPPAPPSDAPPPSDAWAQPGSSGGGSSLAVGVSGPAGGRPVGSLHLGVADPPSLRAPVDWSRGDVPLPWSPRR